MLCCSEAGEGLLVEGDQERNPVIDKTWNKLLMIGRILIATSSFKLRQQHESVEKLFIGYVHSVVTIY